MTPFDATLLLCGLTSIPFVLLAIAYLAWLRRGVQFHFGEYEPGRGYGEERSRRRSFEQRAFQAVGCLYLGSLCVALHGVLLHIGFAESWLTFAPIILFLALAAAFAIVARMNWRQAEN